MQGLREYADDSDFQKKWHDVKQTAKEKAVARIKELTGVAVRPDALMDVQVFSPVRVELGKAMNVYNEIYFCKTLHLPSQTLQHV